MVKLRSNFLVKPFLEDKILILDDLCNDVGSMSVTNDAENVIMHLVEDMGYPLDSTWCVAYRDTEGDWDRLGVQDNGTFSGFLHGPGRAEGKIDAE
jgi:hypothetical protein